MANANSLDPVNFNVFTVYKTKTVFIARNWDLANLCDFTDVG